VAAGIVAFAHGSDGGGSVRIPAASCGLFGFKPTRARLPDGPYVGEGWAGMAIDGFLTRSVRDTARMLDACQGPDLGAPYVAPPLATSHADAISRPPRRLRVAVCDTTFTGEAIDPEVAEAVRATARLLESLGHHVEPAKVTADVPMMMRAWTDIVGVGTALGVKKALKGRPMTADLVEGVSRGACAHADTLHPTRYLEAVGEIHAFGRQMAGSLTVARISCCPPRWPNLRPASAASTMTAKIMSAIALARRESLPIRRSARCSTPPANRRPACPWRCLPAGFPSASTLRLRSGR
jgi:amidase